MYCHFPRVSPRGFSIKIVNVSSVKHESNLNSEIFTGFFLFFVFIVQIRKSEYIYDALEKIIIIKREVIISESNFPDKFTEVELLSCSHFRSRNGRAAGRYFQPLYLLPGNIKSKK